MQFIDAAIHITLWVGFFVAMLPFVETAVFVLEPATDALFPIAQPVASKALPPAPPLFLPPATVTVPDLGAELEGEAINRAIERHIPAMAATVSAPVATLSIELPVLPELADDGEPVQILNYPGMKVAELRVHCTDAGIQWRNAHGKNKHLKKAEMLEALETL